MPPRKINTTSRRINATPNRTSCTSPCNMTAYSTNSPKFRIVRTECQWRMGSYRNVYHTLTSGARTWISPTVANRWIKYVNSGVRVYKFNHTELNRIVGNRSTPCSITTTRQLLKKKFGVGIKDVTRCNNNTWLVATAKNINGRPFANYNWM